jgi:transcriptional regulator with XRE-family HTH domain
MIPDLLPISVRELTRRREALGMTHGALAARSGVSEPTVKRILGGHLAEASFANVAAIANALGVPLGATEIDPDELCRQQARKKAEQVARLVQGTSALESQAVDEHAYRRLVERSYHELLAGSRRRLWAT